MKRMILLITLGAAVLSLNSCGLPGALVRTVGNTANNLVNMANSLN